MYPSSLSTHERMQFLRRRITCRQRRGAGLFSIAPWINLALLAFLFFAVQSQRVLSPGISLALPVAPFTGGAPGNAEVVTVLRNGAIFFHDERILRENLAAALTKARRPDTASTLLVEADGEVPHRLLVEVYTGAQAAGYRDVVLASRLPDGIADGAAGGR